MLYLLYIHNFSNISNKFKFLIHADDTTVHNTYDLLHNTDTPNTLTIGHTISNKLSLIFTWLTQNKLLINTSITTMTVFHMPQKHVSYQKYYNG